MRLLVVGAGATGGYFGGRLALSGHDVTFLVREGRAATLRERGLHIHPHDGEEMQFAPRLVTAENLSGPYDLVLVTVKATGLAGAVEDLRPAVGPGTLVVPLLNGMTQLDLLRESFGEGRVLGGVVQIVGRLDAEGDVVQMTPLGRMAVGALPDSHIDSENRARIAEVLSGGGFPFELAEDITAQMWGKWTMIASAGALTCLMRGTVGDIVAQPGGADLARDLLGEAAGVAAGFGHPLTVSSYESSMARLTQPGSDFTSSLYRDVEQGLPAEGDHLIADLARRARRIGVKTPLFDLATLHLGVYESRRATASRAGG